MFVPDRKWIGMFAEAVRNTMHRCGATANSCIEAACVGVGVGQEFGCLVEAIPVAVQVIGGKQATVLPAPGGPRRRRGFDGHLIMYFPAACMMVDLTADQFNDPRRGLYVPGPIVGGVARHDMAHGFGVTLPTGTTISYQEMVEDVSWRALPAWTEPSTLTTRLAVDELRRMLAAAPRRRRR